MEKKNLIIQTAFIGDVLLSLLLVKKLKDLYPNEKIIYYCRKGLGSFLLKTGLVDKVIEVDKSSKQSIKKCEAEVLLESYDRVICPHQSLRTLFLVLRISSPLKIGFKNKLGIKLFFHKSVKRNMSLHDSLRQLSLLTPLSHSFKKEFDQFLLEHKEKSKKTEWSSYAYYYKTFIPSFFSLSECVLDQNKGMFETQTIEGGFFKVEKENHIYKKTLQDEDIYLLDKVIFNKKNKKDNQGDLVAIAPGSIWETKKWPISHYIQLIQKLHHKGLKILLIGASNEKELGHEIKESCPYVFNAIGKFDLFSSFTLLNHVDLIIGNDSGALHLGSLWNLKTLVIFGPTVPRFGFRPWVRDLVVIENQSLECRPCGSHGAKTCPIKTHECMLSISHQVIYESALRLLKEVPS